MLGQAVHRASERVVCVLSFFRPMSKLFVEYGSQDGGVLETKGSDYIKMRTATSSKAAGVESCLLALVGEARSRPMFDERLGSVLAVASLICPLHFLFFK